MSVRSPVTLLTYVSAALVSLPSAVGASEVSFAGGFTTFAGPVATRSANDPAVLTQVNGSPVFADQIIPGLEFAFTDLGLGYRTPISIEEGGQPVPSVDFRRTFFGPAVPNLIAFSAATPVNVEPGGEFVIGTFTLTNGGWFGNSSTFNFFPPTDFGFSVTTRSTDPLLDGLVFADTLRFVVTNPDGPDFSLADDADYFYFVNHPELGTMSVIEAVDAAGNPTAGNTGTVSLKMRIGSLIPVGLSSPTGGAFIGSQVPEPRAWMSMGAGLVGLAIALRRRKRLP